MASITLGRKLEIKLLGIWRNEMDEYNGALKGADIAAYTKGFCDGLEVKNNFKYSIFGYDLKEVLDILGKYEETKMANKVILRKEAIELIQMEGWKLFIDRLIRDKIVVLENEQSNVKVVCNCSAADICPQGKIGSQDRCSIWVNKNTLRK